MLSVLTVVSSVDSLLALFASIAQRNKSTGLRNQVVAGSNPAGGAGHHGCRDYDDCDGLTCYHMLQHALGEALIRSVYQTDRAIITACQHSSDGRAPL